MTYAFIEDNEVIEYPIYSGDIKLRFLNTSFTEPFSPPPGYIDVLDVPQPEVDHYKEECVEETPIFIDGVLTRKWKVIPLSAEVQESRVENLIIAIKIQRNARLKACDWTQLPDVKVDKEAWAIYRQELRDLPLQEGFPFDIEWPTAP